MHFKKATFGENLLKWKCKEIVFISASCSSKSIKYINVEGNIKSDSESKYNFFNGKMVQKNIFVVVLELQQGFPKTNLPNLSCTLPVG